MAGYNQAGPASTPGLYLEQSYNEMNRNFDEREAQLADLQLPENEYNEAKRKIQADYNEQSSYLLGKKNAIEKTQAMVDARVLSEAEGMESNWATVLTREAMAARTATMAPPKQEKMGAPFTPTRLDEYGESAGEFAGATRITKGMPAGRSWRKQKIRSEQSILRQYKAWRTNIGYDIMGATRQRQVDSEWDSWVGTQEGKWNWRPDRSKVIQALRAKGPLSRGYGAQFRGTPTGPGEARNPLHDSIAKAMPKKSYDEVPIEAGMEEETPESKTLTDDIVKSLLQEASNDPTRARQLAAERGYTL